MKIVKSDKSTSNSCLSGRSTCWLYPKDKARRYKIEAVESGNKV